MSYTPSAGQLVGELTITTQKKIEANKDVTPTTSQQEVTPSAGYDGMAQVTVGAIRLENKTVTPSDAVQTITAGENYDGLGTVTVEAQTDTLDALFNDDTNPQTVNMTDDNNEHACYGFIGGLNVVLPNTITTIETRAFNGINALSGITAPGVTEIKRYAFANCYNLGDTTFPALQTIRGYAFSNMASGSNKTFRFPVLSKIEEAVFLGSSTVKDIYIGYNGVCTLDNANAFNNYSSAKITVHVTSDQLANYEADTVWASAVSSNYITLVGDYSE